jgi:hypothetical protein
VDHDAFKTVRRVELLARLELLDELIKENASRVEFVREMGWDANPYVKRSKLLAATRRQYQLLLRELLSDQPAYNDNAAEAPAALERMA